MTILDELKKKANGKADSANNIAEAIKMMGFAGGNGSAVTINNNMLTIYTAPFEPDEGDEGISNIVGVAKVGLAVVAG